MLSLLALLPALESFRSPFCLGAQFTCFTGTKAEILTGEDLFCFVRGLVRYIGVSNFTKEHLEALLPHCKVVPHVNQVSLSLSLSLCLSLSLYIYILVNYCIHTKERLEALLPHSKVVLL